MNQPLLELRLTILNEDNFASETSKSITQVVDCFFNNKDLAPSVDMVIYELLDNVIEYNQWERKNTQPLFTLFVPQEKHMIEFKTSNPIEKGGEHHQAVLHSIKQLQEAKTPQDAAVKRMVERGMNPGETRSHIGLFHIASGGFCQVEAHVDERSILHVCATMRVNEILTFNEKSTAPGRGTLF